MNSDSPLEDDSIANQDGAADDAFRKVDSDRRLIDIESDDDLAQREGPIDIGWQSKAGMIVPLVLFFVLAMGIDTSPIVDGININPNAYYSLVALRVVLMMAAIAYFSNAIVKQFSMQFDWWGWITGIVGAFLWIGICHLEIERNLLVQFTGSDEWLPARDGVNPFRVYAEGASLYSFLALRFTLLVVCVPIAEELFLRGFLMRAVEAENWTEVSLTRLSWVSLVVGTVYGVLSHPGEVFAAAVWFTLVTVLMVRTGKFWNCVVAHATTNLLLGIYVCLFSAWHLW